MPRGITECQMSWNYTQYCDDKPIGISSHVRRVVRYCGLIQMIASRLQLPQPHPVAPACRPVRPTDGATWRDTQPSGTNWFDTAANSTRFSTPLPTASGAPRASSRAAVAAELACRSVRAERWPTADESNSELSRRRDQPCPRPSSATARRPPRCTRRRPPSGGFRATSGSSRCRPRRSRGRWGRTRERRRRWSRRRSFASRWGLAAPSPRRARTRWRSAEQHHQQSVNQSIN